MDLQYGILTIIMFPVHGFDGYRAFCWIAAHTMSAGYPGSPNFLIWGLTNDDWTDAGRWRRTKGPDGMIGPSYCQIIVLCAGM